MLLELSVCSEGSLLAAPLPRHEARSGQVNPPVRHAAAFALPELLPAAALAAEHTRHRGSPLALESTAEGLPSWEEKLKSAPRELH